MVATLGVVTLVTPLVVKQSSAAFKLVAEPEAMAATLIAAPVVLAVMLGSGARATVTMVL